MTCPTGTSVIVVSVSSRRRISTAWRMQPDHPTELFDIFDDPSCKKNLAAERQPLIERAETLFTEQHGENPWYPNLTLALKK